MDTAYQPYLSGNKFHSSIRSELSHGEAAVYTVHRKFFFQVSDSQYDKCDGNNNSPFNSFLFIEQQISTVRNITMWE